MSTNPYENEPGFEEANEPSDKKNQKEYVQKVVALLDLVCAVRSRADLVLPST